MITQNDLAQLIERIPQPPHQEIRGATEEEIQRFERAYRLSIPPRLKQWLSYCNGAALGMKPYYGVGLLDDSLNIESTYVTMDHWPSRGWIPIGTDGCGNFYVVITKGDYGEGEPVIFSDSGQDWGEASYIVAADVWEYVYLSLSRELDGMEWPFNPQAFRSIDSKIFQYQGVPFPWDAD